MPSVSDFPELQALLANNESWAKNTAENDPELLPTLATGQKPGVLWIGCADSRVPETTVLSKKPGDVFVHVSPSVGVGTRAGDMSTMLWGGRSVEERLGALEWHNRAASHLPIGRTSDRETQGVRRWRH